MKKCTFFAVILLCIISAYSQIPQTISWQGILQDADAKNLSGTYSLTVKLYDVATGGATLWSETHSNIVIADGLVNLTLGSVTPFGVNFDDEYWLEITVGSGTPLPRIKLTSVPYSLHSKTADNITGSITEIDPLFSASPASGILSTNISNWNTSYSWGNHSSEGYLKSFIETDPLFSASPASGILSTNISNWNTSYSWGNHSSEGYLKSFIETDPLFSSRPASGILSSNITNWNTAYSWGDHSLVGYLTGYTETDPKWSGTANTTSNIGRTGNVGIGTSTPTAQLHTTSTVRFQGAGTPATGKVLTSDVNGNATWQNPPETSKWTTSGNNIYNNNIGNIGIGINNPVSDLHISNNKLSSFLLFTNTASGETTSDGFLIGMQYQGDAPNNRYGLLLMKEEVPMYFKSGSSGSYSQLTLLPSGNIGIGLNNPVSDLHISSSTLFTGLSVTSTASGETSSDGLILGMQYQADAPNNRYGLFWMKEEVPMHFKAGSSGDFNKQLTLLPSGNIGIGTASPGAGLHLKGSGFPSSFMYIESNTGQDAGLRIYEGSTDKWHIFNNTNQAGLQIYNTGGETAIFAKQSNAFVGLGTTVPTQKLDVNGNARIRSIASDAYFSVLNRKSDGTLTTATSDIRLKDNISTLNNSLERVKQLRGVSFTWKSNPEYGTRIGFVAQEFEKVLPELAFTNPADGFMGINYAEMTAVLVEAMKEQQTIIDEQNKRIDIQQNEIDDLKLKYDKLMLLLSNQ